VMKAYKGGTLSEQVFCAFVGVSAREDFIPYVADFFLQLEDVKWTVIAGIVHESLVISVRNLGYTKNAGEFVRRYFADVGSAGGHRSMAKAVVPVSQFRARFGDRFGANGDARRMAMWLHELVDQFLHEKDGKSDKDGRADKEGKAEKESRAAKSDLKAEL